MLKHGEAVGIITIIMNIDDILELLQTEFIKDPLYTFERKKEYLNYEDNGEASNFFVDIAVLWKGNTIMVISEVSDREYIEKLFYQYHMYCSVATYYVVLCNDEFIFKERPYCKSVPKLNRFALDNTPVLDSIQESIVNKEGLIDLIKQHDKNRYVMPIDIREFLTKCAQICNIDSLNHLIYKIDDNSFEYNNHYVWLESSTEANLIKALLNSNQEIPYLLYRYTNEKALTHLFDVEKKVHSMSSLVTMNDPTEMDYANTYITNSGVCIEQNRLEFNRNDSVHSYITSLTELKDDLTLWRLYGDDAKGICIEYKIGHVLPTEYILARVSYADENKKDSKLDFIAELLNGKFHNRRFILRRWNEWQHFFKPYEYSVEKEVRLLTYVDDLVFSLGKHQRKWITTSNGIHAPFLNIPLNVRENEGCFPLSIKGILFGSKFLAKDANRITWEYKIRDEFRDCVDRDFQISISKIDNYR